MIMSARYPYHGKKRISYNKHIIIYKEGEDVWIYKKLLPQLRHKILSYLSNPEVDKLELIKSRDDYQYMNSEVHINEISDFQRRYRYKWCKYCGERSTEFAFYYSCMLCKTRD